jgi:glyoxylase-like metal-dependent hydrolase (beta-lactamase superfamily II)|tara:strand:- start:16 stop:864 length:849 start_codon:yes stop_codon:yes gene_type:complete
MDAFGWDFDEAEISIESISDNIHVLFGLGGNILVSTGADGVLLVDDQMPELKYKILRSLRKIGGKSVDYIINTHWHFDHAEGNLVFGPDGAKIVAHENSRKMMLNPKPINLSFIVYPQQPYPLNAVPQITYQDSMKLHLNGDQIELYHFGHAHTTGDTAVYLRNSNVLHMGDVFNMTGPPFIDAGNGGSIDGIIRFCEEILKVVNDETVVVPGHGPISTTEDIQTYIDMLIVVRDRIQAQILEGKSLQEIIESDPTKEWRDKFGDGPFIVGVIDRAYAGMTK